MKLNFDNSWKKSRKISLLEKAERAIKRFSFTERVIFYVLIALLILSTASMLWKVNAAFLVEVPAQGGTLVEGMVGAPRFINPLLADTDTDRNLSALVYSGLLRVDPEEGVREDLAESYSISEDGLTYSFVLRDDIYFHDGEPITATDVQYTIEKIKDPVLRSPHRRVWDNVEEMEVINQREIRFTIKQPYAPFIFNFSIGIVPKHLWENFSSEQIPAASKLNEEPVGSGPFKVSRVKKSRRSGGLPESYRLTSWERYPLGEPFIKNLRVLFYSNEEDLAEALSKGRIGSAYSISPALASELEEGRKRVEKAPMSRSIGIYFNQENNPVFRDRDVRRALDTAIDKEELVGEILYGYGTVHSDPLPPKSLGSQESESTTSFDGVRVAEEILEEAGWHLNEETGIREKETEDETATLSFTIHTGENFELITVAEKILEDWKKVGVNADLVAIDSQSSFVQNIVRPREYEALLFGSAVRQGIDFYPLWHSSQTGESGLNFALYSNPTVDEILEELRIELETDTEEEPYQTLAAEITNDLPKIFLYWPHFTYVLPEKVKNVRLGQIDRPEDRFLNIFEWHIETEKVWEIFVK